MANNKEIFKNAVEATEELESIEDQMIFDINNFKRELERQSLMTPELEEFIENYMRWDNN